MKRPDLDILLQEGEGTMRDDAHDQGCPGPLFEENGFFTAIFYPNPKVRAQAGMGPEPSTAQVPHKHAPSTPRADARAVTAGQIEAQGEAQRANGAPGPPQAPPKYPPSTPQALAVLAKAGNGATRAELQEASGLSDQKHFRESLLNPFVRAGILEMTIPSKPHSPKQRYRTTPLGRRILNKEREEVS